MYIESNSHAMPSFGTRIMLHEKIVAEVKSVNQAKKIRNSLKEALRDGYDSDLYVFPSSVKKTKKKEPLEVQGKIYFPESSCCGQYLSSQRKYPEELKPFEALYERIMDVYKEGLSRLKEKTKISEFEENFVVSKPKKKHIKKKKVSIADKIKLILDDFTVKKTLRS